MKRLLTIIILFGMICCNSLEQTPVIVRPMPDVEITAEDTLPDKMRKSLTWRAEILAYITELVNQIKHKVNYEMFE